MLRCRDEAAVILIQRVPKQLVLPREFEVHQELIELGTIASRKARSPRSSPISTTETALSAALRERNRPLEASQSEEQAPEPFLFMPKRKASAKPPNSFLQISRNSMSTRKALGSQLSKVMKPLVFTSRCFQSLS